MSVVEAWELLEEARGWLVIVDRDLRAATLCLNDEEPETGMAAYCCQQAAEKTMKAVLVAAGLDPPKTHDLDELADLAAAAWPSLVDHLDACRPLTPWNVEYRYPPGVHAAPLPTAAEVQSALDRLRAFRRAAGVIAGETS